MKIKTTLIGLSMLTLAACGGGGGGGGSSDVTVRTDRGLSSGSFQATSSVVNGATVIDVSGSVTQDGVTITNLRLNNNGTGTITGSYMGMSDTLPITYSANGDLVTFTASAYGYTTTYSITVQELGMDLVQGETGGNTTNPDFFITNTGTGTPDHQNYNVDYNTLNANSGSGEFGNRLRSVHDQGWTGKGTTVDIDSDQSRASEFVAGIAPGATQVDNVDGARVTLENGSTISRNSSNSAYNNAYVGVGALVGHKFNTLSGSQVADIIDQTRVNGVLRPDRAISPVGNLR